MEKAVVIARCYEETEWIKNIHADWQIYLYNKGFEGNGIKLPNVGREAHTYLTFIINHYGKLPDYTVFTQADPFPHVPEFVQGLSVVPMFDYFDFNVTYTYNRITEIGTFRAGTKILGADTALFVLEVLNDLNKIQLPIDNYVDIIVSHYGIFGVSKEAILKHPISFYEKCLEHSVNCPMGAYTMELLWRTIFS